MTRKITRQLLLLNEIVASATISFDENKYLTQWTPQQMMEGVVYNYLYFDMELAIFHQKDSKQKIRLSVGDYTLFSKCLNNVEKWFGKETSLKIFIKDETNKPVLAKEYQQISYSYQTKFNHIYFKPGYFQLNTGELVPSVAVYINDFMVGNLPYYNFYTFKAIILQKLLSLEEIGLDLLIMWQNTK